MNLSKREQAYLKHKRIGGNSSQKGGKFESFYAAYKICCLLQAHSTSLDHVNISSQVEAFVDDLLIVAHDEFNYHQLKNSNNVSWGSKIGSLKFDFVKQMKWEIERNSKFKLTLVVSHARKEKRMKRIPNNLRKVTTVELFSYHESIPLMLKNNAPFRECVQSICALQPASPDKLEALASSILGIWCGSDQKDLKLSEIVIKMTRYPHTYLKLPGAAVLNNALVEIFNKINGFRYSVVHNYLTWEFETTDSGVVSKHLTHPEFALWESQVLNANPTSFDELEIFLI